MSEGTFFETQAKQRTADAIKEIEGQTSAEVVVALRKSSGYYRHTDYLLGFVVAMVTLLGLLFLPQSFPLAHFPADLTIGFVLGTLLSATIPPLRRILTLDARMNSNVAQSARSTFVELGISRTSGRSGILVYLSIFERSVEIVPDIGIPVDTMGEAWSKTIEQIKGAMRPAPDFESFLQGLKELGPVLGKTLPRLEDDVNELPDEVQ